MVKSSYLISAIGQLSTPFIPTITGLNDFQGTIVHSARWNGNERPNGQRIAVIGNGATGVQIIPEFTKIAAQLTVFQRTPNWVLPRNNAAISWVRRLLYRCVPELRKRHRAAILKTQEEVHNAVINSTVSKVVGELSLALMKRQLPDNPGLRAKLTPNYPAGCRRILLSDNYFPSLNEPHVMLETRAIQRITPRGILVDDEEREFDILVLATDFRSTEFMSNLRLVGQCGRKLEDIWKHSPQALYGVTVESLPNFAMLYGPNTNLSHVSVIPMLEAQSRYISAIVGAVQQELAAGLNLVLTPKTKRVAQYNEEIQSQLRDTVFVDSGCSSWYKTEEGIVTNNWPGGLWITRDGCRFFIGMIMRSQD